jgi:arabinofuranan 3-O-arabinosyltransferase
VSPALVVDGDPRTYWAAEPGEDQPSLVVSWPRERQFSGLRLTTWASVTGRRPTEVVVTVGSQSFRRPVGPDGVVDLPDLAGRRVEVQVTEATPLQMTLGAFTRVPAPVVVGEVELVGPDAWAYAGSGPGSAVFVPCGFGPRLEVNGRVHPTQVVGTKADLVRGQPLRLTACGSVPLEAGTQRVRLLASVEFGARSLSLVRPAAAAAAETAGSATVTPEAWGPTDRSLRVSDTAGAAVLPVRENANAGWTAVAGDRGLTQVTVDGWSQGWLLPAGAPATVRLGFAPQQPFLLALLAGALLAVVVVAASLAPAGSVRGRRPAPEAAWPRWLVVASAGLALFLLAGVPAVVAGAAALGLRRLRGGRWSLAVAAAVAVGWVGWAASRPWPAEAATNRDGVSQVVVAVLLALVVTGPRVSPARAPGSGARRRSWRAPTAVPVPPRHASSPPRQGASPRS